MPRFLPQLNNRDIGVRAQSVQNERRRGDYVITAAIVVSLTMLSMWWDRSVCHWFLFPLAACGMLAGVDVLRCLRGKLDLFDPRTVIAFLAFYGFFAAPILHVVWDRFGAGYDLILSSDWRSWLGAMAALNGAGLIAYRLAQNWMYQTTEPSPTRWEIDDKRFYPVLALALTLSVVGTVTYLSQLGGILGEIEAFESDRAAYVGKGWLLMLAWPLAILSFIVLVFALSDREARHHRRWATIVLLLGVAGVGHFILMGWYGSRSATVWALFWMAGIVHYWFRKLSARIAVAGMIPLIAFMYFYGFYKERGRAGLEVLRSPSMWLEPRGYERDLKGLLLGDLARADSNAFILHNLVKDPESYNYRWGLTYAGGMAILIPRRIWPDRPDVKIDAGTEATLGKATFLTSYRVYGLSGEALLNFGPAGVVPMFALYGGILGWYCRKLNSWETADSRMLLAPLFTMWFANALVSDSDNVVFAVVTQGALVIAAIIASSVRCSVAGRTSRTSSHFR
jgi:hypothetical protein